MGLLPNCSGQEAFGVSSRGSMDSKPRRGVWVASCADASWFMSPRPMRRSEECIMEGKRCRCRRLMNNRRYILTSARLSLVAAHVKFLRSVKCSGAESGAWALRAYDTVMVEHARTHGLNTEFGWHPTSVPFHGWSTRACRTGRKPRGLNIVCNWKRDNLDLVLK
jgi:hypothetical protein